MKLFSVLAILLVSSVSWALENSQTVEVTKILGALRLNQTAKFVGKVVQGNELGKSCVLLVSQGVSTNFELQIGNELVDSLTLDSQMPSYSHYNNQGQEEYTAVKYYPAGKIFSVDKSFGSMRDQYGGAHTYAWAFISEYPKIYISHFHSWADDDGAVGKTQSECELTQVSLQASAKN